MKLCTPIYLLKRDAKRLARDRNFPLHVALDQLAVREGFQSWSHLSASLGAASPALKLLPALEGGDLVLIGARPGQGKTLLGLEMVARAQSIGRRGLFFTLDYHQDEVTERMQSTMNAADIDLSSVIVDTSDDISADHIISKTEDLREALLIGIDYLQLLDQKRSNAPLQDQVAAIRAYAKKTGAIFVFISQIDRTYELADKSIPDRSDIRMPNPIDLTLFDKFCFLQNGEIEMSAA